MNARAVRSLLGSLCLLVAVALLAPVAVALPHGEGGCAVGFALSSALAGALGVSLRLSARGAVGSSRERPAVFRREGIAVVSLAWLAASLLGALPFLFCGVAGGWIDALFESTSGFTTTGASIFAGEVIEELPRSIHFWRCLMHWMGGIGIVLVFVAILPSGGRSLFFSEGTRESDRARVRDMALALLRVYVSLTALHTALLWAAGLPPFEALIHGFSTLATGGFSSRGSSMAAWESPAVEAVTVVFMIAAGISFTVWDGLWRHPRAALRRALASTELRAYLAILAGGSLFLTLALWFWGGSNGLAGSSLPDYRGFLACARDATFNLVSIQTCTGYATADFDQWPDVCRVLLVAAMLVGGCGGSTAGGVKVFRVVLVVRAVLAALRSYVRPRVVEHVELDGQSVDEAAVLAATRYFALWILVALAGTLVLALFGVEPVSALTGVVSCLNNVGPGLAELGPDLSYGSLEPASKLVLCVLMIGGRLELYALLALALPRFWRG